MIGPRIRAMLVATVVTIVALLPGAAPVAAVGGWTDGTITWKTPEHPAWSGFWGRSFDLDAGEEQPYDSAATDLTLLHSCVGGSCRWKLVGPHGLRGQASKPVLDQCAAVSDWTTRGSRTRWPNDTWLCAKTGAGSLARLHIVAWPTRTDPTFRVDYRVWSDTSARTIRLELTSALEIRRGGRSVHRLDVTPGERITFVIKNTAGYQHSFFIGSNAQLQAGNVSGLPGVKPFATGKRTFTYEVTDDTLDLRFGCTVPGHYALMNGRFV